jgi:hypothetical protein
VTETEKSLLPYLTHVEVTRTRTCTCPREAWAPCGGQYEGFYEGKCPDHGRGRGDVRHAAGTHGPSGCRGTRETISE